MRLGSLLKTAFISLLLVSALFYSGSRGPSFVKAGVGDNVKGWAWTDTFGWISFNCTNDASCGSSNFGVDIEDTVVASKGNFSGFAWSEDVGWIAFESVKACSLDHSRACIDNGDCSGAGTCTYEPDVPSGWGGFNTNCSKTTCTKANGCTACFNYQPARYCSTDENAECTINSDCASNNCVNNATKSKNIYGWARVLSLGDDGWIRLNGNSPGLSVGTTGFFSGWGWDGNATAGIGVGWVSFNTRDCDTDGNGTINNLDANPPACPAGFPVAVPAPNYAVSATIPAGTLTLNAVPSSCSVITINWNDLTGESWYRDYISTVSGFTPGISNDIEPDKSANVTSDSIGSLNVGTNYYFRVRGYNIFGYVQSNQATAKTFNICALSGTPAITTACNPASVRVQWTRPVFNCGANTLQYRLKRCQCAEGVCYNCKNTPISAWANITAGGCANKFTALSSGPNDYCIDNDFDIIPPTGNEPYKKYRYAVQAECSGAPFDPTPWWPSPQGSTEITPCAGEPTMTEQ